MSLNGRWRIIKIVGPLDNNREEELIGGLTNALDRGQDISQAKQSFINAGYSQEEIESAMRKVGGINRQMVNSDQSQNQVQNTPLNQNLLKNKRPLPSNNIQKKSKKIWIVLIIIVSLLILAGAGVLGLYWNEIFK